MYKITNKKQRIQKNKKIIPTNKKKHKNLVYRKK